MMSKKSQLLVCCFLSMALILGASSAALAQDRSRGREITDRMQNLMRRIEAIVLGIQSESPLAGMGNDENESLSECVPGVAGEVAVVKEQVTLGCFEPDTPGPQGLVRKVDSIISLPSAAGVPSIAGNGVKEADQPTPQSAIDLIMEGAKPIVLVLLGGIQLLDPALSPVYAVLMPAVGALMGVAGPLLSLVGTLIEPVLPGILMPYEDFSQIAK